MEILANQLTGLMDMKIFYKGKNAGEIAPSSVSPDLVSRKGLHGDHLGSVQIWQFASLLSRRHAHYFISS